MRTNTAIRKSRIAKQSVATLGSVGFDLHGVENIRKKVVVNRQKLVHCADMQTTKSPTAGERTQKKTDTLRLAEVIFGKESKQAREIRENEARAFNFHLAARNEEY